jgi:hypothetical protein
MHEEEDGAVVGDEEDVGASGVTKFSLISTCDNSSATRK